MRFIFKALAMASAALICIGGAGALSQTAAALGQSGFELAVSLLVIVGLLLTAIVLYLLPAIVARGRDVAVGSGVILFVNVLIGWTVLGWMVCMLWAALAQTRDQAAYFRMYGNV